MPAILRVAVPVPLPQLFDYLPPEGVDAHSIAPGARLAVPFGRSQRVGVVIERVADSDLPTDRLRPANALLDPQPLITRELLASLEWVARYYAHPLGEV